MGLSVEKGIAMDSIPHIDISDPARIQALLDDERNFSWRAIDSETLDTWSADLGLTGYAKPSIYRAGAVATAGIASTLRHRFWQTVEHQADHTGRRYIGILIYLAAGERSPMELRLASHDIGMVEPGVNDNRLHLIVADKPVEFIGEMELFQLTAPGVGVYRIEHIVLLHERPQPSPVRVEIGDISLRLHSEADGKWTARLHFVTSRVTGLAASLSGSGGEITQSSAPSRLHSLRFTGLSADQDHEATVKTTDPRWHSASRSLRFHTSPPSSPGATAIKIPLELFNPASAKLSGLPLRFGLPFARGATPAIQACQMRCQGENLYAKARPLSRWDDGSVRWALIECETPAALAGMTKADATLHINGAENDEPLPMADSSDETRFSLEDLSFAARLANGMALTAGEIRQVAGQAGEMAVYEVDHRDAQGVAHLRSSISLRRYDGQHFIKLQHRLHVISPALASAAAGGDIPPDCSDAMRANIVGDQGEESTLLKLRSFSLRLPFAGVKSVRYADETWPVGHQGWQLRHDHDLAHEINGEVRESRAKGHIRVQGEDGGLGIGIRNFWQTYPKALSVDDKGIDIQLFPERAGRALPGDDEAWHRLYFWLDEDGYKLKAGLALSSEILIDFGDNPALMDWLEQPPFARPHIDYLNSTGALNPIGKRAGSPLPNYEALTDRAITSFQQDREHFRAYGQLNFGDWFGESQWSWGNNEYDPAFCAYMEFLRGGDPGWAQWAAESARHLADVDTVNFSSDASEIGGQAMHIPGHLGGYLPPYFRSKMRGTNSIPSHTWVEGPTLHVLLTGDEIVYESLLKTRGWLLQRKFFDTYDFKNAREAGWHLIHLCMLAAALDDPDSLNAASIIVERVLERQEAQGGWVRNLGEPHCGCGYPRCRGEAGFMVGVLLSGLRRYHRLTGEQAVADAIIGGARWLIRHTYDEASGYFRYTSCPNRTLGGTYQCTQWVMESLAAAWELSGDAEFERYLRAGLKTIGMFPGGLDHSGLGKALSQQMRYVPSIIAILNNSDEELAMEAKND